MKNVSIYFNSFEESEFHGPRTFMMIYRFLGRGYGKGMKIMSSILRKVKYKVRKKNPDLQIHKKAIKKLKSG